MINLNRIVGATPLTGSERKHLIPDHITTQEALNRWEKSNISQGERWGRGRKNSVSIEFVRELHDHMFNATWIWAGKFRSIDLNLGISWTTIAEEVKNFCDNTNYHIEHSVYPVLMK